MKPTNVYNLGSEGVNVDTDDVHLRDGELRSAQNLQIDPAGGLGGVRRRDGMANLNASALAGSVTGVIALPLPDRSQLARYFYAPIDGESSNRWRKSSDGTTWANAPSEGEIPQAATDLSIVTYGITDGVKRALRWQGFNNKLYYPGSDYSSLTTAPTIHVWDGTTDYELVTCPKNPYTTNGNTAGILSIVPYSPTELLVSTYDQTDVPHGRVLMLSITTGRIITIGPETDLPGWTQNLVVWNGRVWGGFSAGNSAVSATVRWARPEDVTWTTDVTLGASLYNVVDLVVFLGNLYIGTETQSSVSAVIQKRTPEGTWSTVLTGKPDFNPNYFGPFITDQAGTTLFAFDNSVDNVTVFKRIIKTTDGSTWALEYDVHTNVGASYNQAGMPVRDPNTGDIYWPVESASASGKILKRTNAGVWSIVDTAALRGPIGVIKF